MKVKLSEYVKDIEKKVRKNEVNKKLEEDVKDYISYLQHERLIKLLVIIFVGAIIISFLVCGLCFENLLMYLLFGIVFALFLPYIIGFYLLENRYQKLCGLYFKMKKKMTE